MRGESLRATVELIHLATGAVALYFILLIPAMQVFYYLSSGDWVKAPALYLFIQPPQADIVGPNTMYPVGLADGTWMQNPMSMYGLHKLLVSLLNWLHVSVLAAVAIFAAFIAAGIAIDRLERKSWHGENAGSL